MAPAPYSAAVRAKGWRFEIDYEKVEQSDTWSLAAEVPMAQHALLMMWLVSWSQVPCGSLPNDLAVIRAKCKVPPKLWPALEPVLMRGWWLADDGRLYHATITARVLEMLEYRRKEAERRGRNRRKEGDVPELSRGTDAGPMPGHKTGQPPGPTQDTTGVPDTGTGTSSSLRSEDSSGYPPDFELVWKAYPKRPGASKADSFKAWKARLKAGADVAAILAGVQRYAAYCVANRTEPQFIKQPATFFGPGEHYLADWSAPARSAGTATGAGRHAAAAATIFGNTLSQGEVIDV